MKKSVSADYSSFIRQLQLYCQTKSNGCMFITSSNRSGRIVLSSGKITNFAYAKLSGKEAIKAIREVEQIVYRFSDVQTNFKLDESLPDTANILAELGCSTSNVSSSSHTSNAGNLDKKVVEECLIEVIGPMGEFLCEDFLYTSSDVQTAIDNIAAEIAAEERASFLALLAEKGHK